MGLMFEELIRKFAELYEACARLFAAWQHRPCGKGSGQTSLAEGLNNNKCSSV